MTAAVDFPLSQQRHEITVTDDLTTVSMDRWRSRLTVTVRAAEPGRAATEVAGLLQAEVLRLERAASRFREDSELAKVNRQAGSWTEVSWYFVQVLTAAIEAAEATDGLVDPCLGAFVDAAGYRIWRDGVAGNAAYVAQSQSEPSAGDWRRIEIRPSGRLGRVRIAPGCQLDLGAVAKAWLADRLADELANGYGWDTIANMGGDLRAIGVKQPWTIAADPELDGVAPLAVAVDNAGLATSGQGRRRWIGPDGEVAHHIIDPRTGRPAASPWWSASVLAADATGGNTAATAAMVLGHDAPEWLAARGLDAWLVPAPGATDTEALTIGRWPAALPTARPEVS